MDSKAKNKFENLFERFGVASCPGGVSAFEHFNPNTPMPSVSWAQWRAERAQEQEEEEVVEEVQEEPAEEEATEEGQEGDGTA